MTHPNSPGDGPVLGEEGYGRPYGILRLHLGVATTHLPLVWGEPTILGYKTCTLTVPRSLVHDGNNMHGGSKSTGP